MATIRICNVEGCQRKHYGHGLCQMHYNATPAHRAGRARYNATPARKAARARYNATPARKAAQARYYATPARKAARARYDATPARRAAQARYYAEAKEREQGLSSATTAPTLVPVPRNDQQAAAVYAKGVGAMSSSIRRLAAAVLAEARARREAQP